MESDREEDLKAVRSRSPVQTYFSKSPSAPSCNQTSPSSQRDSSVDLHVSRRAPQSNRPPPSLSSFRSSAPLSHIAAETKSLLPNILQTTPDAPPTGELYTSENLPRISPESCPRLSSTPIRVQNADSIDAALELCTWDPSERANGSKSDKPVLVLNMANAEHPGGGWLHGALAQEEALCYRSSLSFTLKRRYYPLPEHSGLYSPTIIVIRESLASGHELLDLSKPEDLPIISVVSIAAICGPKVGRTISGEKKYCYPADREMMKAKMRVTLRIAAHNGHRRLLLGALGCGAFANPRGEVAQCWKEVFLEAEFAGGWWERVVFAVMEKGEGTDGNGNFGVFWRALDGLKV